MQRGALAAPGLKTTRNADGYGGDWALFGLRGVAGTTQYVEQENNSDFVVYSKHSSTPGALVSLGGSGPPVCDIDPLAIHTLGPTGGPGGVSLGDSLSTSAVTFDQVSSRWVFVTAAAAASSDGFTECVAVSATDDVLGNYYVYVFNHPAAQTLGSDSTDPLWDREVHVGVGGDAFYATHTLQLEDEGSPPSITPVGSLVCAMDRAAMLRGERSVSEVCAHLDQRWGRGLLPADTDGRSAPPQASPGYILGLGLSEDSLSGTSLRLWRFFVNWQIPRASALRGPQEISVAPFAPACGGGSCVPQADASTEQLQSVGLHLSGRLAYRNLGSRQALLVTHTIASREGPASLRWYEIDPARPTPILQAGTFAPDAVSRWMGSAAMDRAGDIAIGYAASSADLNPEVRFTGRGQGQAKGRMSTYETIVAKSQRPQAANLDEDGVDLGQMWGGVSLSLDPANQCTFWLAGQYLSAPPADGSSWSDVTWSTRIASFHFQDCQAQPSPSLAPRAFQAYRQPNVYVGLPYETKWTAQGAGRSFDVEATHQDGTTAFLCRHLPASARSCTWSPGSASSAETSVSLIQRDSGGRVLFSDTVPVTPQEPVLSVAQGGGTWVVGGYGQLLSTSNLPGDLLFDVSQDGGQTWTPIPVTRERHPVGRLVGWDWLPIQLVEGDALVRVVSSAYPEATSQIAIQIGRPSSPVAIVAPTSPLMVVDGSQAVLNGQASTDPNGCPLVSYSWSAQQPDGTSVVVGIGLQLDVTPPSGTTVYTLTVTNYAGLSSSASIEVVTVEGPVVNISEPAPGATIDLTRTSSPIPTATVAWTSDDMPGAAITQIAVGFSYDGGASWSLATQVTPSLGQGSIPLPLLGTRNGAARVTVTDALGRQATAIADKLTVLARPGFVGWEAPSAFVANYDDAISWRLTSAGTPTVRFETSYDSTTWNEVGGCTTVGNLAGTCHWSPEATGNQWMREQISDEYGTSTYGPFAVFVWANPAATISPPNGELYGDIPTTLEWTWTIPPPEGASIDVVFTSDNGATFTPVPGCARLAATATSCVWQSPGPAPTDGLLQVQLTSSYALSQAVPASIRPPATPVFITPAWGWAYPVGQPIAVAWAVPGFKDPVTSVDIDVSVDGGVTFVPVSGCSGLDPGVTTCEWVPSETTPAAVVSVTFRLATGLSSTSARFFMVSANAAPTIALTLPTPGWVVENQAATPIHWTTTNAPPNAVASVSFSTDGGQSWTKAVGCQGVAASQQECSWFSPGPARATGLLRIDLTAAGPDGTSVGLGSNQIALSVSDQPAFAITSPAWGSALSVGAPVSIHWTLDPKSSTSPDSVSVSVSFGGLAATRICDQLDPSVTSCPWSAGQETREGTVFVIATYADRKETVAVFFTAQ